MAVSNTTNRIFLIGFMGSGKSHWGKIWAAVNQYSYVDLDEAIVAYEEDSVSSVFEKKGETYFREIESLMLRTFSGKNDKIIIACGGGTPCFNDNMDWMNKNGITVYLKASPAQLMFRLLPEKDKRPIIKNISDDELENFISKKLEEREKYYLQAQIIIPVENATEQTFALNILNK